MRKPIFDAIRTARKKGFTPEEVQMVDVLLDRLQVPRDEPASDGLRHIGAKGLDLIKKSEGLRLKAYYCPAGVLTIGYGSTGNHVKPGQVITEAEAESLLRKDLDRFERGVAELAGATTQGQFDAMVSLAFNIGLGAFGKSTLLKKHKAGDYSGAAAEFGRWTKAGGKTLPGLVTRRAAEAAIYRGR